MRQVAGNGDDADLRNDGQHGENEGQRKDNDRGWIEAHVVPARVEVAFVREAIHIIAAGDCKRGLARCAGPATQCRCEQSNMAS